MKRMIFAIFGTLIFMGIVPIADGIAQDNNPPKIKVALALDKSIYTPGNPMRIVITLANTGADDIITSEGFSDREFYLFLQFFDGKGNIITSDKLGETYALSPPPPRLFPDDGGQLIQGEVIETLAGTGSGGSSWAVSFGSFDDPNYYLNAYDFYPLAGKSGNFTVKAVIPMTTYPVFFVTSSGIEYAPLDSSDWHGTVESNIVSFTRTSSTKEEGEAGREKRQEDRQKAQEERQEKKQGGKK